MSHLGIFGLEFKKKISSCLKSAPSDLPNRKILQKTKMAKFGTQNTLWGYFWTGVWKQYCHIFNQHPLICLVAKFREIMKMPKFRTKNASCGYFWATILKNLLSYLKSAPSNFSNSKFREKTKIPEFETKNALFGYFWLPFPYLGIYLFILFILFIWIWKKYSQIWNQHLWI